MQIPRITSERHKEPRDGKIHVGQQSIYRRISKSKEESIKLRGMQWTLIGVVRQHRIALSISTDNYSI
ncbi:hypothetical protein WS80_29105 [Burkholderia pseudomultivorans]|nr:hypothetical protein WS80_29105 [Burkholderia pseudomultivorans]